MTEVFGRIHLLHPGEGRFPIHAFAAVGLRPGQAGGAVADRAVVVVVEGIFAVERVAAHAQDEKFEFAGAAGHFLVVALDAAVGEVDAEDLVDAAGGFVDVLGGRRVLRVDDAAAMGDVAIDEREHFGVQKRRQARGVAALGAAGVAAAAVEKRVNLLDGGESPIGKAAELRPIEFGGLGQRVFPGELVGMGEDAVEVGFRHPLPGQPGLVVEGGEPVGADRVARRVPLEIAVLAVKRLAKGGRRNFTQIVVAALMAAIDDGVGQGWLRGERRGGENGETQEAGLHGRKIGLRGPPTPTCHPGRGIYQILTISTNCLTH